MADYRSVERKKKERRKKRRDTRHLGSIPNVILKFLYGTCGKDRAIRTINHVIQVYLAKIANDDIVQTEPVTNIPGVTGVTGKIIKPVFMLLHESGFQNESDFSSSYEPLMESLRSLLSAGKELMLPETSQWASFVKSPFASALNQTKLVNFVSVKVLDVVSETLCHMTNVNTIRIELEYESLFSEDGMNNLGSCIAGLQNLSQLSCMAYCDVTPILHPISARCTTLGEFGLHQCSCDGKILCTLLANQPKLHSLTLYNTEFNNVNMQTILETIKQPLRSLSISKMQISHAICHIRGIIQHLHTLKLDCNGLTEKDTLALGECLPDAKHLTSLNLSHNNVGKAVCILGCVIHQLKELHLVNVQLRENDVLALSKLIPEAKCLSELNLSRNNVGRLGGRRLCESLKYCSNLKYLRLTGTGLTQNDVGGLKEHLSGFKIWVGQ